MDADFPGLCVQKYVRPVEDMDVSPNPLERTSFSHTAQLSAFERLPLEIRQMVYSWLGYPVGGMVRTKDYVWDPVKDDRISCWLLKKIVSFSLWRWDGTPLGSDPHRAVHFVTKHPLLGIQSGEFDTEFIDSLFLVNKNIYSEVMSGMFHNMEIVFGFQLSDKAIHYCRPDGSWTFANNREASGHYQMTMPDSDFRYLTRVSLSSLVGDNFSTNYPRPPTQISAREFLVRQASSIQYLAVHCPSLVIFKLSPNLGKMYADNKRRRPGVQTTVPSGFCQITLALAKLASKCEMLEEIIMTPEYVQHKSEGCWDRASRTTFPNCQIRNLQWTERAISLKGIAGYLREDLVKDEAGAIFKALAGEIRV